MFSYWEKTGFFAERDIIVLGAGFVGLWTAISLREKYPNHSITILERGNIPTGASTKNAGFSCFGSPSEIIENVKEFGEHPIWELVEKRYRGLKKIQQTFSATQISYQQNSGYECLMEKDVENVAEHLNWLNNGLKQITGENATFVFCPQKMETLGLKGFTGMIENKLEGNLHPVLLLKALEQKARTAGIDFLNGLDVQEIEQGSNQVILTTNTGQQLICKSLVIGVNAFAKKLLPDIDVFPRRGQVCITRPIENLKLKGCFHFDAGYYYFRDVGNRILIGGARNLDFENENTEVFNTTEKIQKALKEFLIEHIDTETEPVIEQQWSGIMGFGTAKEPIVKQLDENIFCAVRMSGMGVALAPIVGEEVAALV